MQRYGADTDAGTKTNRFERMIKMGLDITAHKKLKIVANPKIDEDGDLINYETEWQPGVSMEWSEENFPGRAEGIESSKVYSWEDSFGFRAGSYIGYGQWRRKLKLFARGDSFQELINFADNEGVIGPIISKKLSKDFLENEERAKEFDKNLEEDQWWFNQYKKWQKAFEMAADNGAVDFH